ncbi:hypothetical protein HMPREF1650_02900 [Corynebacterium freneyi DNF00450]|uniref:Uncharacterized protein n=1 Tax=Corynebacterium freneyi DNF00450 TaxID=1287475 RepID=A0A096AAS5_9CORY|nr:hypothetical protein HMPREF1650_02900 [Corynebacterium freneyi DNF00450]
MSVADRIAQQEQQKREDRILGEIAALREEIGEMTSKSSSPDVDVQTLAERIDLLRQAQNGTLETVVDLISRSSDDASGTTLSDVGEHLARQQTAIDELTKTVVTLGEMLAGSEKVTLADGSETTRRDIDAASTARRLEKKIEGLSSTSEALAREVAAKSKVSLDTGKVVDLLTERFENKFDKVIEERAAETVAAIEAIERRMDHEAPQGRAARRLEKATAAITASADRVEQAEKRMTWAGVGSIMMSLVPLAVVALAAGLVVDLGAEIYGIGPLFSWIWGGFEAAAGWWKLPWAIVGLAGAAGLTGLVVWGGRWLYYVYNGWSSL